MSTEQTLVWSGAAGAGGCRFAWVEPIAATAKHVWVSHRLADETVKDDGVIRTGVSRGSSQCRAGFGVLRVL